MAARESAFPSNGRRDPRIRIIEAGVRLVAENGADAATTRAIATAASVQPPTIYRLFGDKDGLFEAIAEQTMVDFVAAKSLGGPSANPVEDLRSGMEAFMAFGAANRDVFVYMYGRPGKHSNAAERGQAALRERVRRVAAAGRLVMGETAACDICHAMARGAVFILFDKPSHTRDAMIERASAAAIKAVCSGEPPGEPQGCATLAATLHARLGEVSVLTSAEIAMMAEWLDRIANRGPQG